MKNTLCEKIVWYGLSPTIFKFIKENWKEVDIRQIKKLSKQNYKNMIQRTPDIGSLRKNSLRIPLAGGMLWLSIYGAMNGKMDEEGFDKMVEATIQAPLLKNSFQKSNPFILENQKKMMEKNKITNSVSDSEYNWNTEMIYGRDEDEYTILYHRCGLCALGKQEHHEELIPYMCKIDYETFKLMGAVLHRSSTLAEGGDCCDFHVCKKGSKWDEGR